MRTIIPSITPGKQELERNMDKIKELELLECENFVTLQHIFKCVNIRDVGKRYMGTLYITLATFS